MSYQLTDKYAKTFAYDCPANAGRGLSLSPRQIFYFEI
jgi:hypothetical protein